MLTPNYKTHSRPANLIRIADGSIENAKQFIGNASINLPEYNDPELRAINLRHAIEALQRAERALLTQHLVSKAAQIA